MPIRAALPKYARFLEAMPVIPSIAAEVLFMVGDTSQASFATLEDKLALDPGLSARLLKIANSAAYGRSGQVGRVSTALSVIGFQTVRNLILLVIGSRLLDKKEGESFWNAYWSHTLLTAFFARDLARTCGLRDLAEDAFLGSLLFHLGQVSFWLNEPQDYEAILVHSGMDERRLTELEVVRWGFDHRELGAELLETWGFPRPLSDVAREHGKDNITSVSKRLVRLVSVASVTAQDALDGCRGPAPTALRWLQEFSLSEEQASSWAAEVASRVRSEALFTVCQELLEV